MFKVKAKFWIFFVIIPALLVSCSENTTSVTNTVLPVEVEPTQAIAPTEQPTTQPTEQPTIQPTEQPTIQLSPTPEGQIFRDDFTTALGEGWTWENENKDNWSITSDGWLQIVGQNDLLISSGKQSNLLCRSIPEGDYEISTHIKTNPVANFQQSAIYLYQDPENFITINRGYCDLEFCFTGGNAYYMDYKVNGTTGTYRMATKDTDVYLKLEQSNGVLTGYYSNTPDEWTRLGRFGNYFTFTKVCIGAGNGADVNSNVVGLFDYFEISKP